MRVVTYNIHHGEGTDRALDLPRIARVIRALHPDVVLLQEVDRGARRTGGVNQAEALARELGMQHAFGEAMPLQGGSYGEAVLSAYPMTATRTHALPYTEGHEPRCLLEVELEVPGLSQPLVVLATHLDHMHAHERAAQARAVNALLAQRSDRLVIFGGDINAEPGSEEMDLLDAAWTRAEYADPVSLGGTYPSDEPDILIDHIFTHPAEAWKVKRAVAGTACRPDDEEFIHMTKVASDHVPAIVEYEVSPR